MLEKDYIAATNLAKIKIASEVLLDVMAGDEYGVNHDDYHTVTQCLYNIKDVLFKKVQVKE